MTQDSICRSVLLAVMPSKYFAGYNSLSSDNNEIIIKEFQEFIIAVSLYPRKYYICLCQLHSFNKSILELAVDAVQALIVKLFLLDPKL
jgi:hypothetical protein